MLAARCEPQQPGCRHEGDAKLGHAALQGVEEEPSPIRNTFKEALPTSEMSTAPVSAMSDDSTSLLKERNSLRQAGLPAPLHAKLCLVDQANQYTALDRGFAMTSHARHVNMQGLAMYVNMLTCYITACQLTY